MAYTPVLVFHCKCFLFQMYHLFATDWNSIKMILLQIPCHVTYGEAQARVVLLSWAVTLACLVSLHETSHCDLESHLVEIPGGMKCISENVKWIQPSIIYHCLQCFVSVLPLSGSHPCVFKWIFQVTPLFLKLLPTVAILSAEALGEFVLISCPGEIVGGSWGWERPQKTNQVPTNGVT